MTVKQLIGLLHRMPYDGYVTAKDRYGCRYSIDTVTTLGYDYDGDEVSTVDVKCEDKEITLILGDR